MRRLAAIAALAGLLATSPAPAATPESEIEAVVTTLYAVYRGGKAERRDESRLYSRRTRALIAQWARHLPTDEVTPMGDFDWFCQCQDWDAEHFVVKTLTVRKAGGASYEASVTYDIGWGETRTQRLVMVREDAAWKIDDIVFQDQTETLRAALTAEMAEPAA